MPLRVLITNFSLEEHGGTQLYVRDLAAELSRQGHSPAVYTPWPGPVAHDLDVPVVDSLGRVPFRPDIIHGHHHFETLSAIRRFPGVPAIYVCHNHEGNVEAPPIHPAIRRYCGVSRLCIDRLRATHIAEEIIVPVSNSVDLSRFRPRPPLPQKPTRALVFSNYARDDTYLPAVREACAGARIDLTVVGKSVGNQIEHPEAILGDYDIVFAKARAAMEAMAVGCAVILCDFGGLGPMVDMDNFDQLRPLNFGFQALISPHTTENIARRLDRYNPISAEQVRAKLRSTASLEQATHTLVALYGEAIKEPPRSTPADFQGLTRWQALNAAKHVWRMLPAEVRDKLKRPVA